jgi:hypothetical protein
MTLTGESGRRSGSWKIVVDPGGNERSWVKLLPPDKTRREGDLVTYNDGALMVFKSQHVDQFLHCYYNTSYQSWKVNGFHYYNVWNFIKFQSHMASRKHLKFGVPIIIM